MKIFVHVHLYYIEMWKELSSCLDNLKDYKYDLCVTIVSENEDLRKEILAYKADANILLVKNKGYDLGPFIDVLNKINLDDYDYLIKLHTKRDLPGFFNKYDIPFVSCINEHPMQGARWRNALLEFIRTKENIDTCLNAFEQDQKLGMVSSYKLITQRDELCIYQYALEYLIKHGIDYGLLTFVAGSMFIARAKIFKRLYDLNLTIDDFNDTYRKDDRSLAHVMERALGAVVTEQGFEIRDVYSTKRQSRTSLVSFYKVLRFIFQYRVTSNGYALVKFLRIPIFRKKIKE